MAKPVSVQTNNQYCLEEQVGFMLKVAGQRHSTIFQLLAPFNLTLTQFCVMVKLLQIGECSQNELGRQTATDVATIKAVIGRLRKRNLVEVKANPFDKRQFIIAPTNTAKKLEKEIYTTGKEITEKTLNPLTGTERKMLMKLLAKIC